MKYKGQKNVWRIQVTANDDPVTGKRRRPSEIFRGTKTAAKRRETELKSEIDRGDYVPTRGEVIARTDRGAERSVGVDVVKPIQAVLFVKEQLVLTIVVDIHRHDCVPACGVVVAGLDRTSDSAVVMNVVKPEQPVLSVKEQLVLSVAVEVHGGYRIPSLRVLVASLERGGDRSVWPDVVIPVQAVLSVEEDLVGVVSMVG